MTGHKIADTPADFMRENDKLELLRRIAARMQQAASGLSGNAILAADLQHEIETYLSQRWQQSPADAARIAHAMIEQLRARNFILCFYGVNLYGFVHRAFLEYFCASEIKHRFDKRGLAGGMSDADLKALFLAHYQEDSWHEILRLICGMVSPRFAGPLIEAILPDRATAFEQSKALTLAIQCLAEIADLNEIPETSESVLDSLCGWFEHTEERNGEVEKLFEKNALPAVERIGKSWVGREVGVNWLKLTNKKSGTFAGSYCFGRMVASLWSDHEETGPYLTQLSQAQELPMQHMAFDALARCFKVYTYTLLKEHLMYDEYGLVIWTLTKHYLSNSETYALVTQSLQNEHENVRAVALRALAEHYNDRAETYPLLTEFLEDRGGIVREAAVLALAGHYHGRAEVYGLLMPYLQDNDGFVRRATVRALASIKYSDSIKLALLSSLFDSLGAGIDPLKIITQKNLKAAAEKFDLSPEMIRQHYEEILVDIPLLLEWLLKDKG